MKKKGFTLAEILITLVIIGIVAALTIAPIYNGYKKMVTVAKLKTAYSTIQKVIQTSEAQNGEISSWMLDRYSKGNNNPSDGTIKWIRDDFVNTYMLPYLKVKEYKRRAFKDLGYKTNIKGCDRKTVYTMDQEANGILLENGMYIVLSLSYFINKAKNVELPASILLIVDLDGPGGANTYGIDVFDFEIALYRKINPVTLRGLYEENIETYVSDVHGNNPSNFTYRFATRSEMMTYCKTLGTTCGALIVKDGWQIKDDYPCF